jgi:hypothetical protein
MSTGPTRPRARAPARRDHHRLHRHDLPPPRPKKSRPAVRPSSASGGCVIAPSPTVWRKPATASSPSPARTANAIERLHEEFKRRIKTQTVLPSADTAAMLFWALLASGQINMRKVNGWQTLATNPIDQQIDLAACQQPEVLRGDR